jgi:hypothetical protein
LFVIEVLSPNHSSDPLKLAGNAVFALVIPLTFGSVVSTLAIAALFFPLRRRIQNVIDRRFFRRKYNAQQVLAAFAVTARDETDLQNLTDELLRVVDTTVQPEFVGLWLKEPAVDKATR